MTSRAERTPVPLDLEHLGKYWGFGDSGYLLHIPHTRTPRKGQKGYAPVEVM
jgi:hypothetical protein